MLDLKGYIETTQSDLEKLQGALNYLKNFENSSDTPVEKFMKLRETPAGEVAHELLTDLFSGFSVRVNQNSVVYESEYKEFVVRIPLYDDFTISVMTEIIANDCDDFRIQQERKLKPFAAAYKQLEENLLANKKREAYRVYCRLVKDLQKSEISDVKILLAWATRPRLRDASYWHMQYCGAAELKKANEYSKEMYDKCQMQKRSAEAFIPALEKFFDGYFTITLNSKVVYEKRKEFDCNVF